MTRRSFGWSVLAGSVGASSRFGAFAAPSARPSPSAVGGPGGAVALRVGPSRSVRTIAEAAAIARDGSTIEIDSGTYRGDVVTWTQRDLVVRASGGRVRLVADGAAAEAKAIWVVRSARMQIEGFDFEDAAVPHRNGAGIRYEGRHLRVRDCVFRGNQSGILGGLEADAVLEVDNCEFDSLRREDGQNHHLYAGAIGRLVVTGSYFHRGAVGHLLKSRAALSLIRYNRLTDEDGSASYEVEFPNGGLAVVVGNVIQQSAWTENPSLIAYGAEGCRHRVNELHLVNNTLIDDTAEAGVFVRTWPGTTLVRATNNLWVGNGRIPTPERGVESRNNFAVDRANLDASNAHTFETAIEPGSAHGVRLAQNREFRFPRGTAPLPAAAKIVGATQTGTDPALPR